MRSNRNPASRNHGSADQESLFTPGDEHADVNATASNENREGEKNTSLQKANFVLLCGTLLATAFAAFFTGQQWRTADDQERRQLRAYVGIIPGDIENFGDRAKQRFTMTRKNYGQTPAYDLTIVAWGQSVTPPKQQVSLMEGPPPPDIRGAITLFPTAELPFRFTGIIMPQENFANVVNNDDWFLTYYGTLQYRDVFDQRHWTYFCWTFTRSKLSGKDAEGCGFHNNSD